MSDLELWAPEYRVEVNTYGDPADSWAGNALRFDDVAAAEAYAHDLHGRWMAVKHWRVIDDLDHVAVTSDTDPAGEVGRGGIKVEMF